MSNLADKKLLPLLKEWMRYDQSLGTLVWKKRRAHRNIVGRPVGTKRKDGYYCVSLCGGKYLVHRLVFLWHKGFIPKIVDHKDRNPSNNRISNLRPATKSQNYFNSTKLLPRNTSGVRGVSWSKDKNKWTVRAVDGNVYKFLGYFDNINDARAVRRNWEQLKLEDL